MVRLTGTVVTYNFLILHMVILNCLLVANILLDVEQYELFSCFRAKYVIQEFLKLIFKN